MRAFGFALLALGVVGCFVDRPITKLSAGGVEARQVQAFEAPGSPGSTVVAPGDFVLSGGGLHLVVGGMLREGDARGAVLEMGVRGNAPTANVVLLRPTVYVDGMDLKVRVLRIYLLERAGTPVLRIEGVVPLEERVLEVARELSIGRVPGTLSVTTRLYSARGERAVRVGARLAWGGPLPFMPGVGVFEDENWHRADWVGGEGAFSSVCFGFERGGVMARANFEDHAGEKLLLHTDVAQAQEFSLAPGVPHYEKHTLVLGPPGLASAVRAFGMWRGAMFPEVWAYLPHRPEGSEVSLFDAERRPLLHGKPDERGRVVLPLVQSELEQVDRYIAVASAYGHAPSEDVNFRMGDFGAMEMIIPQGGQIRVRVRAAVSHEPLAARVRLTALQDSKLASLGPDYRASGAGDTVIAVRGQVGISVPRGRYGVQVTHGPEWSIADSQVDVTETFSPLVEADLTREVLAGNWIGCDLHLHAAPSPDSEVSLEDRLASLAAEGVQFAVATDHNHVTDYGPALAALSLEGISVESGVEVTTDQPTFGHFNAYPFPGDSARPGNGAPAYTNLEPAALFRSLHEVDPDLIVQVNHPRSTGGIGYFDVMSFDPKTNAADPRFSRDFDVIEVFNGFDLGQPANVERVFSDWLHMLAGAQRLAASGSSDSHQVRYQLAGYPRTYVSVTESERGDPRAIVRAIRAGASFVSSGPFLEVELNGGGPGSTVSLASPELDGGMAPVASDVALQVRVQAPSWMPVERLEVFVGTERVVTRELTRPGSTNKRGKAQGATRFSGIIPIHVTRDTFVIVRVTSSETIERFAGRYGVIPMAFSNPIFIDADGDGQTPWPLQ